MQLRQLTFLRFIAAAAVVVFHYGKQVPSLAWGLPAWHYANTAVSFFFFLSGFILTHVYASRPIARRLDFYMARAARVLPLYALALLAAAIFHLQQGKLDWHSLALNALLLQAWVPGYSQTVNAPGWSLSVEVFFYLSFPMLIAAIAPIRSGVRLALLALGAWALNLLLHISLFDAAHVDDAFTPLDDFSLYHPLPHVATFVAGMCGARVLALRRADCERWALPLVGVALTGVASLAFAPEALLRYHHNGLFVPLYFPLVIGLAAAGNTALARVLSWRPLEFLGELSYGLYILQEPAAWLFFALLAASGVEVGTDQRFWLLCAWLIGCAGFSYLAVEVPMRSLIQRAYQLVWPLPAAAPNAPQLLRPGRAEAGAGAAPANPQR